MATVVKDFKVKAGLIVEGTTAKVNNFDVLTKNPADDAHIIGLVGGSADTANTPDTVVKRDSNGDFAAGTITANLTGDVTGTVSSLSNHDTADLAEGTNLYFTNQRALDATASAYDPAGSADQAELDAVATANAYTDTAVSGAIGDIPTSTDELPEGVNNLYYTDERVRGAVNAGDGLDYNSTNGVFSADLGYGLQFDGTGQISVDGNVIATDQDVTNAFTAHDVSSGVHGVTGDVVGTTDTQTLSNKTLGSDLDANGNTVTNLPEPVNASDAATKGYVDAVSEGLHIHASVQALSDSNIVLPSAPASVDGVTLADGNRVLLVGQTDPAENGIYVVVNGTTFDLVRADDFNSAAEIQGGDFTFVTGGSTYAATGWVQINTVTTLGTDPIEFDQFSGAGEYTAGNGLTLTGAEFAIDTAVTATREFATGEVTTHSNLTTGVHGVTGNVVGTTDSQTLTNKTLGSGTALSANVDAVNTHTIINLADPVGAQDAATKKYVDDEIVTVNGTIDALTTTDIAEGTSLYFTDERAVDALGAAIVAGDNITVAYDDNANTITITGENGVAGSDTDDLTEGATNLYFTEERAQDAVGAMLGGTQTNITVTYDDAAGTLNFVAENGVADSTTTDLAEGTNLYFTDARAVSALEAVVPNFTEVDLNSVATQVAATSTVATASQAIAYTFDGAAYRSAKFLVKVAYGTHTEVSEVLLTLDTSDNIAITEYAVVGTNGSAATISAGMSGTNVQLLVTTNNNNSTITVMGTLLV